MGTKKLTVTVEEENYAFVKSHAESHDVSIEDAANLLFNTGISRQAASARWYTKKKKERALERKDKAPKAKAAPKKAAPKASKKAAPKASKKAAPKVAKKAAPKAASKPKQAAPKAEAKPAVAAKKAATGIAPKKSSNVSRIAPQRPAAPTPVASVPVLQEVAEG